MSDPETEASPGPKRVSPIPRHRPILAFACGQILAVPPVSVAAVFLVQEPNPMFADVPRFAWALDVVRLAVYCALATGLLAILFHFARRASVDLPGQETTYFFAGTLTALLLEAALQWL